MTQARLQGFWRRYYTPPRMVVAAAGNISHQAVVELVDQAFPATAEAEPVAIRSGRALSETRSRLVLEHADTEQAHLMLGVPGLDRHDDRRVALEVLNTALGGGMSSRLFQEVRERRGLAYSVYSATTNYADAGQLAVYAGCQPERLGEVVTVIRDVLAQVATDGLTEAELARAKGSLRGGLVLGLEDTASRMNRIGRHELDYGQQRSLRESLRAIDSVRLDQVAKVAAEVLCRPLAAAVVGPFDSVDALPRALSQPVTS